MIYHAISNLQPCWVQEVIKSYERDEQLQPILESIVVDRDSQSGYSLNNGVLRYNGRIVLGKQGLLRE